MIFIILLKFKNIIHGNIKLVRVLFDFIHNRCFQMTFFWQTLIQPTVLEIIK